MIKERILAGLFFCSTESNEILENLKPEWNEKVHMAIDEKCSMLNTQCSIFDVFPWEQELSNGIDYEKFCESFFIQPDLFIRLRPGKEEAVKQKLRQAGIEFRIISDSCVALHNTSKIDSVIELDKEALIQDYNSQQVATYLPVRPGRSDRVWDCCAGSGGKSILAYDLNPEIELTASDARESILANLKKRFEKAGIKNYKYFRKDLSKESIRALPLGSREGYNVIIADVPCTGSGTWSRTPEQFYFFDEKKIGEYAALQKKIISTVIPLLRPGGFFIYITCSVFRKENEEAVGFIKEKLHLQLKQMELLKGYDKKADSMFIAVFKNEIEKQNDF